jgi:nucleoside transporter
MSSNADLPLLKTRLSIMMFLEFFIWGAWLPLIFGYLPSLGFKGLEISAILWTFNISALIAMFFSNQFADRNFAAQKFLSFSHFIGGAAMLGLFWVKSGWTTTIAGVDLNLSFWAFFSLMLVHTLFYVPTISITNSIAFANLREPSKEFGPIRLWGTIGWIAAAWPFVFILVDWDNVPAMGDTGFVTWLGDVLGASKKGDALRQATTYTYMASGVASLLLALFSLTLPHTPPKPASESGATLAWVEALSLLRHPFVLVLFVVTFFDASVHQMYFFWTGTYLEKAAGIPGNWVMPVMSIGQVAEILTMAALGFVLKSLGWRLTMVIGILGHAARFTVFALAPFAFQGMEDTTFLRLNLIQWSAVLVNMLHGVCYAFFFATVYIFVDEFFPKDIRSSAQGLFNVLILGIGPFVGNYLCPKVSEFFPANTAKEQFRSWFLVPAGMALVAALFLLLFFHPPKKAEGTG